MAPRTAEEERLAAETLRDDIISSGTAEVDENFTVNLECCSRYMRARNYNHDAAAKMLRATIAWRREFGVSRLVLDHMKSIEEEGSTGKIVNMPFKDQSRPIMLMRPRLENSQGKHGENIRHLVYQLERAVRAAKHAECDEKWVVMIDFGGYSMSNAPPLRTTRETLSILQDHYPERLHRAYLVDAPWLFQGVFRAISPFIDAVTKAKIVFASSSSNSTDALIRHIPPESVEKSLGGSADFTYSADEYFSEDRRRWLEAGAIIQDQK